MSTPADKIDTVLPVAVPSVPAPARQGGADLLNTLLLVLVALIAGVLGAAGYQKFYPAPPPVVAAQPRIMVVDWGSLIAPITNDPSLGEAQKREQAEALVTRINAAVNHEIEANSTVVIDSDAIVRAPRALFIQDNVATDTVDGN